MPATPADGTIQARDFGALPDSRHNAAPGLQAAIQQARETGAARVQLEAGTYSFNGLAGWDEEAHPRACYVSIQHLRGVEICEKAWVRRVPKAYDVVFVRSCKFSGL